MAKVNEFNLEVAPCAKVPKKKNYLPDLVRLDYFLFPKLKNGLVEKDLPTTQTMSLQLIAILRSSMFLTINRVSKQLNIAGNRVSS